MKKIISVVSILMILLSTTALAGSVPEDLLHYDEAHIFFGELISYTENGDVAVLPVKKIKGDIKTGTQTYKRANVVGDVDIKPGNVYLFTYFDENNPTDIFDVTGYDTKTLKLKNVTGDMWERFEKYLNDGKYEIAEQERIDRKNEATAKVGKTISLTEYTGADRVNTKSSVSIYSGPNAVEVERDKFFETADKIVLEKIEEEYFKNESGFDIIISLPESMQAVYITSDGKVSKQNSTHSLILPSEYIIKAEDMAKLSALLDSDRNGLIGKNAGICAVILIVFVLILGTGYKFKKKVRRNVK